MTVGIRFWIRPKVAVDRLMQTSATVSHRRESPLATLRRVVDAAGRRMGSREKDRERLVQQLAGAGFRQSGAVNLYNGSRVVASLFLSAALASGCVLRKTDGSTLIMAALAGLLAGYCLPGEFVRLMTRRRRRSIQRALPNTLDLLTICVESGLGLDQGILHVARELGRAHH